MKNPKYSLIKYQPLPKGTKDPKPKRSDRFDKHHKKPIQPIKFGKKTIIESFSVLIEQLLYGKLYKSDELEKKWKGLSTISYKFDWDSEFWSPGAKTSEYVSDIEGYIDIVWKDSTFSDDDDIEDILWHYAESIFFEEDKARSLKFKVINTGKNKARIKIIGFDANDNKHLLKENLLLKNILNKIEG